MKGQVSAEMLILLAVVIAIVVLAAMSLKNTAESASTAVSDRTQDVLDVSNDIANCEQCTDTSDCSNGDQCTSGCCR